MSYGCLDDVTTLAFDIFGTVLDLQGSLEEPTRRFLSDKGVRIDAGSFWERWRVRQRIEQYQDSLMMLGHSGYLETCRRALVYCLRSSNIEHSPNEIDELMSGWNRLEPFPDVSSVLSILRDRFRIVALSNGDQHYLELIVRDKIKIDFDAIISVEKAGFFKPHPGVYRMAAKDLRLEPSRIMMVAAHAFDIAGARACGYRGAYVDRYGLPFEETVYQA